MDEISQYVCDKHMQFKKDFLKKILKGKKTITIRRKTALKEGDLFYIHSGGYVHAIGRVIKVYKKKYDEISEEEAKKEGIPLDKLKKLLKILYGENSELYIVEIEVIKIFEEPIFSEHLPYGGLSPVMVAKLAKKYGIVEKDDIDIIDKLIELGSIRKLAEHLGGNKKRIFIRKIVRKYYEKLKELGRV